MPLCQIVLPSINWECNGTVKPNRAVTLYIDTSLLVTLSDCRYCMSTIASRGQDTARGYVVLPANPYKGNLYDGVDPKYNPIFLVYFDAIWYCLELNGEIVLSQNISSKIKNYIHTISC